MRRLSGVVVVGAMALAALFAAPASQAAVEAGDDCVADTAEGPYSLFPEMRAAPGPLPLFAPVGGVVTRWRVSSAHSGPVPERLGVFRPTGGPGIFQVVGESNEEMVPVGTTSFPTRIPVQAGDRFGPIAVINDTLYCLSGTPGDGAWGFSGSVGTGSAHQFMATSGIRIAMVVTIEADADGDGYGDETQDRCPQSAATQAECPTVALGTFAVVKRKAVVLLVSSSSAAPVKVSGTVKLGKGKPLTLAAAEQSVPPGALARFKLAFPKRLSGALDELAKARSLKLNLTATATDLAGRPAVAASTVKLRGRE